MSEIEKALAEFNEVMAELKNSTLLKEEAEEEKMEEAALRGGSKDEMEMESYEDADDDDMEAGDYMKEEDDKEALEYMEQKGVDTLDLSPSNLEKAYEAFRAEKEEERAYDLVKAEFEARYQKELEIEKQEIAKSKFNASSEIASLREELMTLRKSLEDNEIAKAATVEEQTQRLSEDFSRVGEMSWDELHGLFNKHEGGI